MASLLHHNDPTVMHRGHVIIDCGHSAKCLPRQLNNAFAPGSDQRQRRSIDGRCEREGDKEDCSNKDLSAFVSTASQ
jgi:hypothetical protein